MVWYGRYLVDSQDAVELTSIGIEKQNDNKVSTVNIINNNYETLDFFDISVAEVKQNMTANVVEIENDCDITSPMHDIIS